VADLPDDLSKVLGELESRKRSLENRLQSIDTAIQSIQGLQTSYSHRSEDPKVSEFAIVNRAEDSQTVEQEELQALDLFDEMPMREDLTSAYMASILQATSDPVPVVENIECRDFVLQPDSPNTSIIEKEKALRRPNPKPAAERRKQAHLNVYVNQNSDWASRQLVSPQSKRATFRQKTGQRCPKCGSQDTRLSVTKGLADCFMFLFDYSLARCRNCDTKFRIWRSREDEDESDAGEKQLE
jgi:hypothetical protein